MQLHNSYLLLIHEASALAWSPCRECNVHKRYAEIVYPRYVEPKNRVQENRLMNIQEIQLIRVRNVDDREIRDGQPL